MIRLADSAHQKPPLQSEHLMLVVDIDACVPNAGNWHLDVVRILAAAAGVEKHIEIVALLRGTNQRYPNFGTVNRYAGGVLQEQVEPSPPFFQLHKAQFRLPA